MKLNQVYVINLNSNDDKIIEKINKVDWNEEIAYYVYPAVNGWDLENEAIPNFRVADWWKIDSENLFYNREVKPGEIGCTLSHYKCIKDAFDSGYENILILEEDFKYLGKFPTTNELFTVPKDASIIYLDRKQQWEDSKEERINNNVTKVGYSYNNHAYIVTRKGMEEINSDILKNIIVIDEIYPAMNGTSDRKDAIKVFNNDKFIAYSLNGGYFDQTSQGSIDGPMPPSSIDRPIPPNSKTNILNDSNWEEYCKKYINPFIVRQEYDVLITEPIPHVYSWNMFTEEFCKELVELGEQFDWTQKRHDFYPTTDNLLKVLGMDRIYNRIINEFVRPLAIHLYGLEGKQWDNLNDESFIVKYPHNQQSHLDLHHDNSNITTLLNLNPGEFEGGGTYFQKWKSTINPKQIGTMTLHPGNITHKHGAQPVTKGTRYVVVSFITTGHE